MRLGALRDDEERLLTPRGVGRFDVRSAEKDPVLPPDRREVARFDAEERELRRPRVPLLEREAALFPVRPEAEEGGRVKPTLRRVGTDGVSEGGPVGAFGFEPLPVA